jgi:hypothetical protein
MFSIRLEGPKYYCLLFPIKIFSFKSLLEENELSFGKLKMDFGLYAVVLLFS